MMRIGVISDTHGEATLVRRAMGVFKEMGVERIIHCGDLCTPSQVKLFSEIPTDFVYGNCDAGVRMTIGMQIEEFGGTHHGDFGSLELEGKKIAFLHGQRQQVLDGVIDSGEWDLVCYGHTHKFHYGMVGNTVVLNPGALQRRSEAPGVACVDLPEMTVARIPLEGGFSGF